MGHKCKYGGFINFDSFSGCIINIICDKHSSRVTSPPQVANHTFYSLLVPSPKYGEIAYVCIKSPPLPLEGGGWGVGIKCLLFMYFPYEVFYFRYTSLIDEVSVVWFAACDLIIDGRKHHFFHPGRIVSLAQYPA